MSSAVPVDELVPCQGFCCSISSLFFTWPECFGLQGKGVFLCLEFDSLCCKFPKPGFTPPNKCFVVNVGTCYLIKPTVCIKSTNQTCCLENRCSLPCDDEVPCIFNLFGLTCCYQWACKVACCSNIAAIKGVNNNNNHKPNTTQNTSVKPNAVAGTGLSY